MRKIIHHLLCTVDWCDRNQYAHGLCGSHYQRLRAGRDMNKPFQTHKKHGETNTLLHRAWIAMRARCNNPNNKKYKHYGGRGIKVCDEWQNDFAAFHAYVGNRPSTKHTLDRKDVNGNYEPGNVRWVTWDVQSMNKTMRSDNTSGYIGVARKRNKWRARFKGIEIGSYETKEEAANMYDCFVLQLYGADAKTNFDYS